MNDRHKLTSDRRQAELANAGVASNDTSSQ